MTDRIVKVALPLDLIKRMDKALAGGQAGMETRAEFIREAAENLLTELTYPEAPPEPARAADREGRAGSPTPALPATASPIPDDAFASIPAWEMEELRLADLAGTALRPIPSGASLDDGVAKSNDEPLLGLHNRDYPSLWAAGRLARYSVDGLPSFEDFRRQATDAAWFYGTQLAALEEASSGTRLRALFPSNPQKREAAERGFQAFAIGSISRRPPATGPIPADGPLFLWRLCQLARKNGELVIGLTGAGRSLLDRLTGLSLELPHDQAAATEFLAYVSEVAPGDRWGFDQIVTAVAEEPDREQLVSRICRERSDWSLATSSSIAQGYVARAREWGLVEPRLRGGKYRLTEFGETWLRDGGRG